ncbi:molybdenum cofactor biosynthesis protein MoaE [Bacillus mojavensis]|uniref:Molybdenum cofactor biosynthesis protein MoaE, Molybdopterin synthase catalytic subunit MoaE n=1 Tax=Bacillus mojavensis TaxID=72360 RepID=A0ABX6LVR3_BACMO|nr:molybdenum cofactor biosynthesis protein MoaE [Bacillus mojavensis]MEC1678591.1 molybdenum cofactor biosynthesis protein MoaE [Bacillus mojavensis]MEC1710863.1 molybdenum cofactor biosynthesis protein MoaE [Bacillus mojavensis]QJC95972.1 Molybdenum cofactor biosynthesis protein MoaE, Molybdopterin synthase catalytic subunit MoaE [Bacillus mojavensis]
MGRFEITKTPIVTEDIIKKVEKRKAGAITTFIGTVREWTNGKKTIRLEYEAYEPMAVQMLAQIGAEIEEKWKGASAAITHRIGVLDIGEAAVVIAVSSPHRKAAYEANEYAIERIKQIVPIWKKEIWEDGEQWIGDQLETTAYPNGKPDLSEGEQHD